jgi:large subunit ribosomal protein L16
MLQPKKHKFRKAFKGRIKGDAKGGTDLNFGSYGLKALEPERITARQIEAARRAITRHIKRQGRLWIRIFPDVPVSKKPAEVRQGKGKGAVEYWAARVKPGRILFELDGVPGPLAAVAFQRAAMKLPIKTKVVARLGDTSPVKKSNKVEDMRVKSDDQLTGDLVDLKREAFNLRFQAATGQLERPARIKEVRRDIARIKTLQSERAQAVPKTAGA